MKIKFWLKPKYRISSRLSCSGDRWYTVEKRFLYWYGEYIKMYTKEDATIALSSLLEPKIKIYYLNDLK